MRDAFSWELINSSEEEEKSLHLQKRNKALF